MVVTSLLETAMLVLFGISWPINIFKALRAKTAKGISVVFYFLIAAGYVAGLASKIYMILNSTDPWYVTVEWYVMSIYILNLCMVSFGIIIYFRNKALDDARDRGEAV